MKKTKFKLKSIRSKLLISLISICLVPLVVLGLTSYYQSKSILVDKLENTSSQILREVNRGIDKELTAKGNNVLMLSNNLNFINIKSNPELLPHVMDSIKGVMESNQNVQNVYMGTANKDFYCYPKLELPAGFDPTSRPWYKEALNNKGKVVYGEPYVNISGGTVVVSVSKTVEKDGEIIGVVSMDIDLGSLSKDLNQIKIGNNGYASLLDKKGIILANPDTKIIGTDTFTKLSVWNEVKSKGTGFTSYEYQGKVKYAVYSKSPLTGWIMLGSMEVDELAKDTRVMLNMLLIFLVLAVLAASVLSVLISNSVSSNVKKIKNVMAKASKGDFTETVQVKTQDEIGYLAKDFNTMISNMANMIKNVEMSSQTVLDTSGNLSSMTEQTTASVGQVSNAIDEISQGAAVQASSTQEAASEMEELSVGLEQISNSTAEMNNISENTRVLSNKGLEIVKFLMNKSEETKRTTQTVSEIVDDMSRSTEEINKISDTINQITEQTNLLSLNASIEAARAGESGRGFAVVADEIRKLAERSKSSTGEIKRIVEVIKGKSSTAVNAMEQAKSIVNDQDQTVEETIEIFNKIYSSINDLMNMVYSVKEQVLNINHQKTEVTRQIENISSTSQETAAASQEVSASAEEINATMDEFNNYVMRLQNLAERLNGELRKFKLN